MIGVLSLNDMRHIFEDEGAAIDYAVNEGIIVIPDECGRCGVELQRH